MLLGEVLAELGHASKEQVDAALGLQRRMGGHIGAILIAIGVITTAQLVEALRVQRERSTAATSDAPATATS